MAMDLKWSEKDRQRYDQQADETVFKGYCTATLLSMFLFPPGVILDWFTHPDRFSVLASIRLLSAVGCGLMYFSRRFSFVRTRPFIAFVFYFATVSLSITSMCLLLEGYESPYYAGINLIILVAGIVLPRTKQIIIGAAVILTGYYVPILISTGLRFQRPELLINNASFFLWTTLLAIGCGWLKERLEKESFSRLLSLEKNQKALAEANAKLQSAEEQRSRFFSNISHEFRTPLTLILEYSRKLLNESTDPSAGSSLKLIISQSQLILRHVNDLLDIAKIEAGKHKIFCKSIDLASHVQKVLEIFNIVAVERQINFRVNTPVPVQAVVDPDKVERIMLNLVSNAFKFCPDGSSITCSLITEVDRVVIEVDDNGPGVSPELHDKIFDRFHQGEEIDTRQHGGTGLGLAIVKEFAALHGGRAWVEKSELGGAKFSVELMSANSRTVLAGGSARQQERQEVLAEDTSSSMIHELLPPKEILPAPGNLNQSEKTKSKRSGTILIIEDSPELNRYLAENLGDSYHINVAYDGQQGLEIAKKLKPDLILCDVMMPKLSGADVLSAVRQDADLKNTVVIMLTAKADDDLRVRLLSSGADDYIMKPFAMAEVFVRINNLMAIKISRDLMLKSLELTSGDLQALSAELVQRKSQLEHLTECLELARYHSELSYRAKSRFLSTVSHELRTPVAIFQLSLELIKRQRPHELSEFEKKEFDRAVRASQQLVQLVDTLLIYSQFEKGGLKFKIETFDVNEILKELVSVFKPKAEQKKIEFFISSQLSQPLNITSDVKLFRLIVLNLIDNALKFTTKGTIEITCERLPRGAQISIKDTGIGIPLDQQRLVFEPFGQVYQGSAWSHRGVGLGLCLTKELLTVLEGSIEMVSQPGVGSVFRVVLPFELNSATFKKLESELMQCD